MDLRWCGRTWRILSASWQAARRFRSPWIRPSWAPRRVEVTEDRGRGHQRWQDLQQKLLFQKSVAISWHSNYRPVWTWNTAGGGFPGLKKRSVNPNIIELNGECWTGTIRSDYQRGHMTFQNSFETHKHLEEPSPIIFVGLKFKLSTNDRSSIKAWCAVKASGSWPMANPMKAPISWRLHFPWIWEDQIYERIIWGHLAKGLNGWNILQYNLSGFWCEKKVGYFGYEGELAHIGPPRSRKPLFQVVSRQPFENFRSCQGHIS